MLGDRASERHLAAVKPSAAPHRDPEDPGRLPPASERDSKAASRAGGRRRSLGGWKYSVLILFGALSPDNQIA